MEDFGVPKCIANCKQKERREELETDGKTRFSRQEGLRLEVYIDKLEYQYKYPRLK
jgi:hypothetical protein